MYNNLGGTVNTYPSEGLESILGTGYLVKFRYGFWNREVYGSITEIVTSKGEVKIKLNSEFFRFKTSKINPIASNSTIAVIAIPVNTIPSWF